MKLRQDSLAHLFEKIAKRDEINDLHSLRGPCRHRGTVALSSDRVVDVGEAAGFNHLRSRLFCERCLATCQACVRAYRNRIVGLWQRMCANVCQCNSVLRLLLKVFFLQLSVLATFATECGGLFRDSQFRENSNDVFCCTTPLVNDVQTIITLIRCPDPRSGGIAIW